jgi:hypothetical protein
MGRGDTGAITSLIGLAIMLIAKELVVQAKKSFNPKGTGIFEQFGSALSSSVSKGWKGGELIPGVGMTDTNKIPLIKHAGSGKSALSNLSTLGAGGAGAIWGAARTGEHRGIGARVSGIDAARRTSKFFGGTLFRGGKDDKDNKK